MLLSSCWSLHLGCYHSSYFQNQDMKLEFRSNTFRMLEFIIRSYIEQTFDEFVCICAKTDELVCTSKKRKYQLL
jgi:hypothetical protein